MKKLTQEEVLKRLKEKRGDEFDYSYVEYKNRRTPITIRCKKHNKFFKTYSERFIDFAKIGCELCGKESFRSKVALSQEEVIKRFKEKHGNRYDYSKVNYVNIDEPVTIICSIHGEFQQSPYEHINGNDGKGSNCWICAKNSTNTELFKKEMEELYPQHDWSNIKYKNNYTPVIGICERHGKFLQTPSCLRRERHCRYCGIELNGIRHRIPFEEFLSRAVEAHGNIYKYKDYFKMTSDVNIKCSKHGWFSQNAAAHCKGEGCPVCNQSTGEKKIANFLKEINFIPQYKFTDLKFKSYLKYDFYLPEKNILVEFNGIQHYEWVKYFNPTFHSFLEDRHCDWLKRKYAKEHGIELITIPYWDLDCIENYLGKLIV